MTYVDPVEIIVVLLLGAPALAALILWVIDLNYTASTGKPASERLREKREKSKAPITRRQYLFRSIVSASLLIFFAVAMTVSREYRGWSLLIPIGYASVVAISLYNLQIKWKQQNFKS